MIRGKEGVCGKRGGASGVQNGGARGAPQEPSGNLSLLKKYRVQSTKSVVKTKSLTGLRQRT